MTLRELEKVLKENCIEVDEFQQRTNFIITLKDGGAIYYSENGKLQVDGSPERRKYLAELFNVPIERVKKRNRNNRNKDKYKKNARRKG